MESGVYRRPYRNRDTGEYIFIIPGSYTHTFSNAGGIQLQAARHLPELIERAVLTHKDKSRYEQDHTTGIYTFFAAAFDGLEIVSVKLKVKKFRLEGQSLPENVRQYFAENRESNPYASLYDTVVLGVENVEKADGSALTGKGEYPWRGEHPSAFSTISVADLLSLVKGEAAKYVPQAAARIGAGVQFPKRLAEATASDGIVRRFTEKVNMNLLSQTQSRQFKQWFGDWQNRPEQASKAVEADGAPLVVYHGTNKEFWSFQNGAAWFSASADYAEAMAEERGVSWVIPC